MNKNHRSNHLMVSFIFATLSIKKHLKDPFSCQPVSNKLEGFNLPVEFQSSRKLLIAKAVKVLIVKRILSKKVAIM